MNTKHTPGPWKVGRYTPNATEISILTTGGAPVTPTWGPKFYVNSEQAKANARLIAAAPDLLEALQQLTKWANVAGCGREEGSVLDNNIKAAQAAIAKATGTNL